MTSLPNPSRKGPRDSLAPGSGQIAHIVPIYDHIHLYIYINTENCLGNSAPLYVQHILLEECPLYTSRGADIEYIFIYIYARHLAY